VVLVLVAITIITLGNNGALGGLVSGFQSLASDVFSPLDGVVSAVTDPIGSFLAGAVHYGAVNQENQRLVNEIGQLNGERDAARDNAEALKQLTALLHLPFVGNLETVPAAVTNYGTSNFSATVTLDVGSARGVQAGMPVVAAGGLVGQVSTTSGGSCVVRLITDGSAVVGVRYGPAPSQLAVLNGEGYGRDLSAQLVPPNTLLNVGEVFTTSGLQGAVFPPGIPVAKVAVAYSGGVSTQETVLVKPIANLESLRYVSVVLWGPAS
jgi:rod shape-determining protein MreC